MLWFTDVFPGLPPLRDAPDGSRVLVASLLVGASLAVIAGRTRARARPRWRSSTAGRSGAGSRRNAARRPIANIRSGKPHAGVAQW